VGPGAQGGKAVACLPEAGDGALAIGAPAEPAAVVTLQQSELEGQGQSPGQLPGGGEGLPGIALAVNSSVGNNDDGLFSTAISVYQTLQKAGAVRAG
jgi:hypothetical protein